MLGLVLRVLLDLPDQRLGRDLARVMDGGHERVTQDTPEPGLGQSGQKRQQAPDLGVPARPADVLVHAVLALAAISAARVSGVGLPEVGLALPQAHVLAQVLRDIARLSNHSFLKANARRAS